MVDRNYFTPRGPCASMPMRSRRVLLGLAALSLALIPAQASAYFIYGLPYGHTSTPRCVIDFGISPVPGVHVVLADVEGSRFSQTIGFIPHGVWNGEGPAIPLASSAPDPEADLDTLMFWADITAEGGSDIRLSAGGCEAEVWGLIHCVTQMINGGGLTRPCN